MFVNELSVLFRNSCADAIETNSIVIDSIVEWLWLIPFDNIYHG